MPFDPATSLNEAQEAYHLNADWQEAGSVSKARAFVTAGRRLVALLPSAAGGRNSNVAYQVELIKQQIDDATKWLTANGGAGAAGSSGDGITYADFSVGRE